MHLRLSVLTINDCILELEVKLRPNLTGLFFTINFWYSSSNPDPYPVTLWIRIRIGNPDPGARKLRTFSWKMHFFRYFSIKLTTKKVPVKNSTNFFLNFFLKNTGIFYLIWLKFDFLKIVFRSSVLAWIRIRIRIELKYWIRIESIRIHNPASNKWQIMLCLLVQKKGLDKRKENPTNALYHH
jgi:hypothetical protein